MSRRAIVAAARRWARRAWIVLDTTTATLFGRGVPPSRDAAATKR